MIRTLARCVARWWRTTFRTQAIETEGERIERQALWRVDTVRFARCQAHGIPLAHCTTCWPPPTP